MMKDWLTEKYSSAQRVSNGIYVADFDAEQRMTKVRTLTIDESDFRL